MVYLCLDRVYLFDELVVVFFDVDVDRRGRIAFEHVFQQWYTQEFSVLGTTITCYHLICKRCINGRLEAGLW